MLGVGEVWYSNLHFEKIAPSTGSKEDGLLEGQNRSRDSVIGQLL